MGEVKKPEMDQAAAILDKEDEATLARIDRAIRSADEGRVVGLKEVRQRLRQWLTKSSSLKTR